MEFPGRVHQPRFPEGAHRDVLVLDRAVPDGHSDQHPLRAFAQPAGAAIPIRGGLHPVYLYIERGAGKELARAGLYFLAHELRAAVMECGRQRSDLAADVKH
jgi:hypothetical protein